MTDAEIESLKAEHDRLWREGHAALELMKSNFDLVMALRDQIAKAEGDDHDPIWLMFNGTFCDANDTV